MRIAFAFLLCLAAFFACDAPTEGVTVHPLRAVNVAGPEFGTHKPGFSNQQPGSFQKDYTWNSKKTFAWFAERGVKLFRIPFRWERLQPTLGQPLNSSELKRLKKTVAWAHDLGCQVVLDLHNYGRYVFSVEGKPTEVRLGESVDAEASLSSKDLVDFWIRISEHFKSESAVYAYGIMNEPHGLSQGVWKQSSQAVVSALRASGDNKTLMISGDNWASAEHWEKYNGSFPWINDPASAILYEAHCYFDFDSSGEYRTGFDRELRQDSDLAMRPQQRLQPFLSWCRKNKVSGFIGEIGVPRFEPRWKDLLINALSLTDQSQIISCYWAAGEWWQDYPLSIQPMNNFSEPVSSYSWFLGNS